MGTEQAIEVGQMWRSKAPTEHETSITILRQPPGFDMWIVRREPGGREYPLAAASIRVNYELVAHHADH